MNLKVCIPALFVIGLQATQGLAAADTQLSTGPAYIGVDPGGTQMLRVGGTLQSTGGLMTGPLTVDAGIANGALPTSGGTLTMATTNGGMPTLAGIGVGSTAMQLIGKGAGGTRAALSAANSVIVAITAQGYDGSAWSGSQAQHLLLPTSVWSTTNHGTYHLFRATSDGSSTMGDVFQMTGGYASSLVPFGIGVTPAYRFHAKDASSELQFSEVSACPTLRLASSGNVYSDIIFNTWGADQFRLRGSTYGLNITGTNPRLSIGGADVNRPGVALFVNGTTQIAPTSGDAVLNMGAGTAALTVTQLNGNDAIVGTTTANGLLFRTSNSNRMYIASGGSVTVGTDPGGSELLRVGGVVRSAGLISAAGNPRLDLIGTSRNWVFQTVDADGRFRVYDNTGSAERLTIDTSGNVGLGAAVPASRLHVTSTTNACTRFDIATVNAANGAANIELRNTNATVGNATGLEFENSTGAPVAFVSGINTNHNGVGSQSGGLTFSVANNGAWSSAMVIASDSSVALGGRSSATNATGAKLYVMGKAVAQEIVVTTQFWADHVFGENYKLPTLPEVASYVKVNRHLPGIPSEAEVIRDGLGTGDMLAKHMAKIEELTLYAIKAEQRADSLAAENVALRAHQADLEARLQRLERAMGLPGPKP